MFEDPFVSSLGMLLIAAAVFGFLARLVKMPAVVGYLVAGLVLGPLTGMVEVGESLAHVSEAGIALLLFVVGLELSFAKIRDVGKVAVVAGVAQVALTSLGGFLFCRLLGFGAMESAFLAAALTFSSTVVVVKLLDERRELDALHGRIALGILLVQDVVVIVLLTLLAGLGGGAKPDLASIARGLGLALGGMAALLAFVLFAARYLLPRPLAWAARSPEMLLIWSLCWCFGLVLAAQRLGLSLEIGAFLAGVSLAQLPYSHDLRRRVHPLMNFFIAVFLVSLGIKTELRAVFEHWPMVVLLALFVLLGKAVMIHLVVSRLGQGSRTAFLTGTALAQISEFSFILVGLGVKAGLVGPSVLSITALVGLPTIAISAWLIRHGEALHRLARSAGFFRRDEATPGAGGSYGAGGHRDHIIVVGMNTLGRLLVKRLTDAGEHVLAIDTDPRKLAHLPCDTMLGNVGYLSVLEEAGLPHAKLLIAALRIEETNDLLAYRCKAYGVPCAIHVVDMSQTDNLLEMDADYLMIPKVDGVKLMNHELARMGFLAR
ncbi:MAG: cation:proton antiporter [Chthoniobacteraceae bacterium]